MKNKLNLFKKLDELRSTELDLTPAGKLLAEINGICLTDLSVAELGGLYVANDLQLASRSALW
jgi:hypothetical protein